MSADFNKAEDESLTFGNRCALLRLRAMIGRRFRTRFHLSILVASAIATLALLGCPLPRSERHNSTKPRWRNSKSFKICKTCRRIPLGDPPNGKNDTYHSTERHRPPPYVLQVWKFAPTNEIMRRQSSETIVAIVSGLFFTRLKLFFLL
jgi:hypothetical protein